MTTFISFVAAPVWAATDEAGSNVDETLAEAKNLFSDDEPGDDELPAPGDEPTPSYNRMVTFTYSDSDIYTVYTKCGYQTSLVFDPEEEIQTISVGDRSTWQIIPSGSRLFIRPLVEGVATNMTVITNKRSYQFDIKSTKKTGRVIYVARFTYNAETPTAKGPAPVVAAIPAPTYVYGPGNQPFVNPTTAGYVPPPSVDRPASPGGPRPPKLVGEASPQNPNYNYTFSGPDDLAPLQVYDDGSHTYIRYRNTDQPTPNVYLIDGAGGETLFPATMKSGLLTVETVVGEFALKNANGTVRIYNETINPR